MIFLIIEQVKNEDSRFRDLDLMHATIPFLFPNPNLGRLMSSPLLEENIASGRDETYHEETKAKEKLFIAAEARSLGPVYIS